MIEKLEKTVHITNYYHRNSGGISTSYNALMAAAERHQRKMALIVPGEKDETEIVNDFAKIHYVAAKYSPVFDKRYRIIMPWQYLPGGSSIRKILLEERPQMVEVTDKYTLSMLGAMIRTNKFKQLGRDARALLVRKNGRQHRVFPIGREHRQMGLTTADGKLQLPIVRFSHSEFDLHGRRVLRLGRRKGEPSAIEVVH
ncbi:MAG: GDP-mannose-dependent alpha-(1-6)-phosphatidylinositol dimannoside mannosyltransferase [Acidobacteria bacterium OLB17]|nr:MAG: GDP-mannose-dependent alpha-(1-6)-phosphatidylinositol dimannoside mannosyltransferase [Acidobacteria bacterium OLB17]